MSEEVDKAIHKHAVVDQGGKKVYAYEVDGCGMITILSKLTLKKDR